MEETLPVALGARIREVRKRARLTQAQLGELLAVADHSAVGQWERGEVLIGTENLIFCAEECGASLDYLVWGMGNNLDVRILALPPLIREQIVSQFTQRIEEAEKMVREHPEIFATPGVKDDDARLKKWSARAKLRYAEAAAKRRRTPKGKS